MSSLAGKVALVTGGNSGIGQATAREFHANGAKVVITGRNRETLAEVAQQMGQNVLAVPTDITKLSDIDQLMQQAYETFGKLDILFVNAGIFKGASLEEVAKVAQFLASDDSSFVVGSEIAADGGWLLITM